MGRIGDHTLIRGRRWEKVKLMLKDQSAKDIEKELTDETIVAGSKWSSLRHTVMDPDYGHHYFFVSLFQLNSYSSIGPIDRG